MARIYQAMGDGGCDSVWKKDSLQKIKTNVEQEMLSLAGTQN